MLNSNDCSAVLKNAPGANVRAAVLIGLFFPV